MEDFQFDTKTNRKEFEQLVELLRDRKHNKVKRILNRYKSSTRVRDIVYKDGETLLHLAVKYNNYELIDFFLDIGCDLKAKDSSGSIPLLTALHYHCYQALTVLMSKTDDISIDDSERVLRDIMMQKTVKTSRRMLIVIIQFLVKCTTGDLQMMAKLMAKINCPLTYVVYANEASLTQLTLDMLNYTVDSKEAEAAIRYVLEVANIQNLRVLVQSDRLFDFRYFMLLKMTVSKNLIFFFKRMYDWFLFGNTVFMEFLITVFQYMRECEVKELFDLCDLDVHLRHHYQLEVLPMLFSNATLSTKFLIDIVNRRLLDINAKSFMGLTALHFAGLRFNSENIVRYLLQSGADCNIKDDFGLHCLWYHYDSECVELLLQSGASLNIAHKDTLLMFERDLTFEEIIRFLYHLMLPRLAIDQHLGIQISDTFRKVINTEEPYKNFYQSYLKQVEESLHTEVIPHLTLFIIMTKDPRTIAHRIHSEKVISTITEYCRKKALDHYYYSLAKRKAEMAYMVYRVQCRLATIISNNISISIGSNDLAIARICDSLFYTDMVNFMSA